MNIDIHCHAYLYPKIPTAPGRDPFLSSEQQVELMDQKGIDKAVILPLNNPEAPAERQSHGEVLAICEKHPGRFIPFCNVDPRIARRPQDAVLDDYLFIFEQHKINGAKGVGEVTARIPWDDPQMLLMLEACEQLELPVLFHTITPDVNSYGVLDYIGLPLLEKVVRQFPKLQFIGHSPGFWSEISGKVSAEEKNGYAKTTVEPGGKLIDMLNTYANLWCDISAGSGLGALTRDADHAYRFMDEYQDRICLGRDQNKLDGEQPQAAWLKETFDGGHITKEIYEKITWRNTNRLLGLGLE